MSEKGAEYTLRLAEALSRIPGPTGEHVATMLRRGTLDVCLSAPARPNQQTPHAQDEIYVVVRGRGWLRREGARDPFGPGDALFVPARAAHFFEDFSEDLLVWRIFFGPQGGEVVEP